MARDAFLTGMHSAFLVAGSVAIVAGVLAAVFIRTRPTTERNEVDQAVGETI